MKRARNIEGGHPRRDSGHYPEQRWPWDLKRPARDLVLAEKSRESGDPAMASVAIKKVQR